MYEHVWLWLYMFNYWCLIAWVCFICADTLVFMITLIYNSSCAIPCCIPLVWLSISFAGRDEGGPIAALLWPSKVSTDSQPFPSVNHFALLGCKSSNFLGTFPSTSIHGRKNWATWYAGTAPIELRGRNSEMFARRRQQGETVVFNRTNDSQR